VEGRWDRGFFGSLGIADIFDDGRVVDDIRPIGEAIGPLTPSAAGHLGLTTRCQVAVGIIDAHAGGIGLLGSALSDGEDALALETVIALIGGTSNCHMATSREPIFVPGVWGPYYGAMIPGMYLTEGGQSAAGSLVDFVIESSPDYADHLKEANARGITIYQRLNEQLGSLAKAVSRDDPAPLTRHLHVLDYHLGNRSPHADPHARGTVDGLTMDAGRDALALQYLATIQAVAYGTRAIIDAMNAQGYRIDRILATGGGTKNPLFLQQHADATGMPIVLGGESESVLLGAAILGAKASGGYGSVIEAMRAMSRTGQTILPNPAMRAYHDAKYAVYKSMYQAQLRHREIMARVSPAP
jgi:FGGY-family pentulose kinase